MKVSETAQFTFWWVANSSQAQLFTIMQAESASLFGFRKYAVWKDKRQLIAWIWI